MLKYYHHTAVSRIHLDTDAGLSHFQMQEVLRALEELSLGAAVIRASNTSVGRYVRVAKEAAQGFYDVQIWIVDRSMDVLAPFYYGDTGPDEVLRARVCLAALKTSGLSEPLIDALSDYLDATDPRLHSEIFGRPLEPAAAPKKVGHLTVVK